MYRGNEDVNFSADGKLLAVSEEDNFDVHIVDYEKRQLTWTYGMPDHRDHVQTASEKASNRSITVCCSRSKTRRLVLDI